MVVDNASSDGTVGEISERFPSVELIANDENVGLAKAVSQVAGSSQSEYLFLLNPDTWLEDGALGRLADALDRYPAVGLVGPAIVADDGRTEQPCRRFPRWYDFFWESTLLERFWPASPLVRHYRCVDLPTDQAQYPDWITGAALMLRRSAIGGGGSFRYAFLHVLRGVGPMPATEGKRMGGALRAVGGDSSCRRPELVAGRLSSQCSIPR